MRIEIIIGLSLALGACISGGGAQPPAPLAQDRAQPVLALFEHVLTGYFAEFGTNAPTTCAALRPSPLSAEQEEALMVRFVRLAPASRCVAGASGTVDAITGEPASVVEVYAFTCTSPELCSGWATSSSSEATRYVMRFEGGAWRFTADLRRIAGQ